MRGYEWIEPLNPCLEDSGHGRNVDRVFGERVPVAAWCPYCGQAWAMAVFAP